MVTRTSQLVFIILGIPFLLASTVFTILSIEDAVRTHSQAAMSPAGPPVIRFRAASAWAECLDENSRPSLSAYRCVVDLLPRVAWLGLPVIDQHALLADLGGMARKAVSAAIRLGGLETAVEWAYGGRSIVWQNIRPPYPR